MWQGFISSFKNKTADTSEVQLAGLTFTESFQFTECALGESFKADGQKDTLLVHLGVFEILQRISVFPESQDKSGRGHDMIKWLGKTIL